MRVELTDAAKQIDALTVAGEFLLCAIRSLAVGGGFNEPGVQDPLAWAKEKIQEAEKILSD